MYIAFKQLHSFVAFLSLLLLVVAVVYAFFGMARNRQFDGKSKMVMVLGLVGTHLQMVFGLVLYFLSPLGAANVSGEMMKNATSRLYGMEHPLMMLLAIVLITVGYSKSKRAVAASAKFKNIAIFYTIGLIFILSRIPWAAWLG